YMPEHSVMEMLNSGDWVSSRAWIGRRVRLRA
ncbi:uncharacterized protein METZ01_LOCUS462053, partial [marine metagenome]